MVRGGSDDTWGRIVEVARQQALLLQRTPQFRAEAVKTLAVIQEQAEGTSQQKRRQRVHKLVATSAPKALTGGAE